MKEPRPECRDQGPPCLDDGLAGMVARRLWPLRAALYSYGVARRRHLPHWRRPWGRRPGLTAFCTHRQLARQCEPRQGAAVALADKEKVRAQTLMGRPD